MQLQTRIDIGKTLNIIHPTNKILFVGSCFADNIGQRFAQDSFHTTVNPYGVMYNPASILHTVERAISDGTIGSEGVDVAVFTLGTNHVYILNETGEIVDNCQKRPQRLFTEKELSIEECSAYLCKAADSLHNLNPEVSIIFTVSPIRYAKYGFHESQLSKATLLLAVDGLIRQHSNGSHGSMHYFPAYEIMNDELRDYRFYQPDMLHPSAQAVEYIHECFMQRFFTKEAFQFVEEWAPIRRALSHRPFNPDGEEYKAFLRKAKADEVAFRERWGI